MERQCAESTEDDNLNASSNAHKAMNSISSEGQIPDSNDISNDNTATPGLAATDPEIASNTNPSVPNESVISPTSVSYSGSTASSAIVPVYEAITVDNSASVSITGPTSSEANSAMDPTVTETNTIPPTIAYLNVPPPPYMERDVPVASGTGQSMYQVAVSNKPTIIMCQRCNMEVKSKIKVTPTLMTHVMAALCCIIGCWCFFCVPYCCVSCNNIDHYCPNCDSYVGTYRH